MERRWRPSSSTLGVAKGILSLRSLLNVIRGAPGTVEERLKRAIAKGGRAGGRLDTTIEEMRKLPERWQTDIAVVRQELEGLSREFVRNVADARIRLRLICLARRLRPRALVGREPRITEGHAVKAPT